MFEQIQVGFVGGGNMGEALIKGILSASLLQPDRVHVYDVIQPRLDYLKAHYGVAVCTSVAKLTAACQVIVIAVKPQNISEVLDQLGAQCTHNPLIISIAAGVTIATLSKRLPPEIPVIRVMPNTPALVLAGASALARRDGVSNEQMELAMTLFRAVGKAIEIDEKLMDAVTGLSGSGPAYVLLLIEAMIDGGVLMGIPRPTARELTVQTFLGAAQMLQETGKHPAELKDMITSPGGTTVRGLQVLEENSVRGALMGAVETATVRSKELGRTG